jgi:hypothetical protein
MNVASFFKLVKARITKNYNRNLKVIDYNSIKKKASHRYSIVNHTMKMIRNLTRKESTI